MKHEKNIINNFELEPEDLINVAAFKDKDIKQFSPTVSVVKRTYQGESTLMVYSNICGNISHLEFYCPWKEIEDKLGFRDEDELEEFISYILSQDILRWDELFENYNNKTEK